MTSDDAHPRRKTFVATLYPKHGGKLEMLN